MNRLYFAGIIVIMILGAYRVGIIIARTDCRVNIAQQTNDLNMKFFTTVGEINAKVFNTGVRDIRRILHEKYTIAE